MSFLKDISKTVKSMPLLCLGLVVLVIALFFYNYQKGMFLSGMRNESKEESSNIEENNTSVNVEPAEPAGMNSGPGSASGIRTITSGTPENCLTRATANPSDLLPKDNNDWGTMSPNGEGELENVNLLKSGHHMGVDTVGSTLRNANLQLRSEPPNPQTQVSPWLNTTIQPDLMRVPLELGSN
tara:strand:- start:1706 stop:2254 length:549 start_codon:yes stop_codon:yes gene_type:complete